MTNGMLLGGIATAAVVAGLFFLRFWGATRDRFFLFFALAFWLEALSRVLIGLSGSVREDAPLFYLIRLLAYGLILIAILDRNRVHRRR
ncbi:MAG TPA: DUF5985 family protein [Burkholderiales bacterium]